MKHRNTTLDSTYDPFLEDFIDNFVSLLDNHRSKILRDETKDISIYQNALQTMERNFYQELQALDFTRGIKVDKSGTITLNEKLCQRMNDEVSRDFNLPHKFDIKPLLEEAFNTLVPKPTRMELATQMTSGASRGPRPDLKLLC